LRKEGGGALRGAGRRIKAFFSASRERPFGKRKNAPKKRENLGKR